MTTMARALRRALAAPLPAASTWGLLEALGGQVAGTRALALLKIGRDPEGGAVPEGDPGFRAYRAARRDVERWRRYERPEVNPRTGRAYQSRRPDAAFIEAARGRVRLVATRKRLGVLRRREVRARVRAEVTVSQDTRVRTLPTGGPGQLLGRPVAVAVTDAAARGDFEGAADVFGPAFFTAYGLGEAEVGGVEWVRLWSDGDPEPV